MARMSGVAMAILAGVGLLGLGVAVGTWGIRAVDPPSPTPVVAAASSDAPHGDGWVAWGGRADGTPLRWDPCREIEWVVRRDDPTWLPDLAGRALDRIGVEAGLTFDYLGRADVGVGADLPTATPDDRWQPVVVTLATPREVDWLSADDRALSVPVLVGDVFVTGQVLLNADADLTPDFSSREASWGATLLHEGAHLAGLDHVDDVGQLLFPYPAPGPAALAAGDRRGLAALAADPTCLDGGPVRDLTVATPRRRGAP